MSNILIIDIDSTIPNLALKKVEKYHKDKGDSIEFVPMMRDWADKIYVSCVFTKNKDLCAEWENDPKALIGGTGYDLTIKLPEQIEAIKPRINWGFTTRGCIRNCHFCFVPRKEGKTHIVGDIYDIWDGKSKELIIMDNNILSLPEHFKSICRQIRKEKLIVDFNQGLDLRLLTDDIAQELKTIRHKEYKFSWDMDDNSMIARLSDAKDILGPCTIFIICGFLPYEKILNKLDIIKKMGHNAYIMRHESVHYEKRYIQLSRWANQHHIFKKMTLDEFVNYKPQITGE